MLERGQRIFSRLTKEQRVRDGGEAALRASINTAIAVADAFPGLGGLASLSADVLKLWATAKFHHDRYKAVKEGRNPFDVKKSKIDLTPDVHPAIAIGSEMVEPFTIGFAPTHALEGGIQLLKDVAKMRVALRRLSEIVKEESS